VSGRRIVLVLHEPPVPFGANAAGRWFYVLLKGLVEAGHRVTAFALWGRAADRDEAVRLFPPGQFDLRLYEPAAPRVWPGNGLACGAVFVFLRRALPRRLGP